MSDEPEPGGPQPGGLQVRRTVSGTTLVLALEGQLDLGSRGVLESALSGPLTDGYERIVVDLAGLAFVDSRGLVTLVQAQHAARAEQKAFTVRRAGRHVQRLCDISGLRNQLTFED